MEPKSHLKKVTIISASVPSQPTDFWSGGGIYLQIFREGAPEQAKGPVRLHSHCLSQSLFSSLLNTLQVVTSGKMYFMLSQLSRFLGKLVFSIKRNGQDFLKYMNVKKKKCLVSVLGQIFEVTGKVAPFPL